MATRKATSGLSVTIADSKIGLAAAVVAAGVVTEGGVIAKVVMDNVKTIVHLLPHVGVLCKREKGGADVGEVDAVVAVVEIGIGREMVPNRPGLSVTMAPSCKDSES